MAAKNVDFPAIRDRIVDPDKRADVVFSGWKSRHGRDRVPVPPVPQATATATVRRDSFPRIAETSPITTERRLSARSSSEPQFSPLPAFDLGSLFAVNLHTKTPAEVRATPLTATPFPSTELGLHLCVQYVSPVMLV